MQPPGYWHYRRDGLQGPFGMMGVCVQGDRYGGCVVRALLTT